jgi:hypothetical protein
MKKNQSLCRFGAAKWFWTAINAHNKSISTNTQLSMRWPWKNISHIQVLVTHFFPTPLIKLKLGLQVTWCETANSNPLGPINYLANQKQGTVNIHNFLTVFIELFQSFSRATRICAFCQGPSSVGVDSLDLTHEPHLNFPVEVTYSGLVEML